MAVHEAQCADTVVMVRPCRFQSNPQTAESNFFQADEPWHDLDESNRIATRQFEGLADALRNAGVQTIVIDDTPEPHTPDSIFPNNWVSTHADGTVVLYPMEAPNRRTERRTEILDRLQSDHGFVVRDVIDLSHHELDGHFLEGTGSLVLDRPNRIAYASLSTRTHLDPLGDFAQRLDYEVVSFESADQDGHPIYHTNVLMALGARIAVVCLASIAAAQRDAVVARLERSGHEIVDIDFAQLNAFAGNMLELRSRDGEPVIAMSQQARDSLRPDQLATLESSARIVAAPIDHIERQSGGSVRCMLAEIHLPRRAA